MTTGTEADWDSGKLKLSESSSGSGLVTFDSIKRNAGTDTGSARIIVGNIFSGDVLVKMTGAGITFIEESLNGNLSITTVFANVSSVNQRFIAVSSRHLRLMNGPFPSQYYGTCTILQ